MGVEVFLTEIKLQPKYKALIPADESVFLTALKMMAGAPHTQLQYINAARWSWQFQRAALSQMSAFESIHQVIFGHCV